jgi:hypothetical protein
MLRTEIQRIIENDNPPQEAAILILEYLNAVGTGLRSSGWLDDDPLLATSRHSERPRLGVDLEPLDFPSHEVNSGESYHVYYNSVWLGSIFNFSPQSYWHFRFVDDSSIQRIADDQYMAAKALLDHASAALKNAGLLVCTELAIAHPSPALDSSSEAAAFAWEEHHAANDSAAGAEAGE